MNPKKPRKLCRFCKNECKTPVAVYCCQQCQFDYQLSTKIETNSFSFKTAKRYLLKIDPTCKVCKIHDWQGKPIVLELDHVDGNHLNNNLENIRLLCPNCHSQTSTYKNRNKGNGRYYRRERYASGKSY